MAEINVDTVLKLPKIQKVGILAGILVILVVLYWFLLFNNHSKVLEEARALQTKKQQELREQQTILEDLPKFRKETEEMKRKREVALAQLPDKKDIDKLLKDISIYAVESGLEILLFKPQSEIMKNFYAEIPVDVKFSGSYHNLAMFFDRIANLSRIVNISNLVIDKAKELDGVNVLESTCKATTYRFVEEKKPSEETKKAKK